VRVKKTKKAPWVRRPARSIRSKKAAVVAAAPNHFAWVTTSRAIVSGMICIVVAAALLTAEDAPRVDVEREPLSPASMAVENDTPRVLEATKPVVAKASTSAAPEASAALRAQAAEPQPEPEPEGAPAPASAAPATITGCLESDEGSLLLTDASGENAPTARSWKSGFLKKRPAHVEVEDAVGTLNLRSHIGRRVTATGTLIDRELRARSVRLVGPCE